MFFVLLFVTLCPFKFTIILMGKRELVALLSLSFWCLVIVVCFFLAVPWVCLWFVNVHFLSYSLTILLLEPIVFVIFQVGVCSNVDDFYNRNLF